MRGREAQGSACPCCGSAVAVPTLDMVMETAGVGTIEGLILEAVWRGKGRSVPTQRIFDAMFADDPDGGPSQTEMYKRFKFGLHRLRKKLTGTGVEIVNVGYQRGYALKIEGQK
jgi:hypothetical protein